MKRMFRLYILFLLFSTASVFVFADQPNPSLDDKSPADATTAVTSTTYLSNINKLIEKSRENTNDVNEQIKERAIFKRNQNREEKARKYYEKGVELTNEGKLKEARNYFQKAIRITANPEMAGYSLDGNTHKEDIKAAYQEAVDLYNQKKYQAAKDSFEHVNDLAPDYLAISSYLKIIEQDMTGSGAVAVKQQPVQIKEKEPKEAVNVNQQAEKIYDRAVKFYENKEFDQAKKKFEEVSWVVSNYKDTTKYLTLIDSEAQQEKEHAVEEQQKQESEQQQEIEARQEQHIIDLQKQAEPLYKVAVRVFDKDKMDEAFEKFNEIEKLSPDFKSTRVYLARIDQWKADLQKQQLDAQQKAQIADLRQKELADQQKREQALKDKADHVEKIYNHAIDLYRDRRWEESKAQFESLEQTNPDFKQTRDYLQKIEIFIARAANEPVIVVPPLPAVDANPFQAPPVKAPLSLEDQQKQAQDIAALAEKSAELYHQIADIADDNSTSQTKIKMGQVDDILNGLKKNKERLLRQMQEEQWKRQQEEAKAKQEERRAETEKAYQDGIELLRSHDYAKAKIKFLELENITPNYKATHRYLSRIEVDLKKANAESVTGYEQKESEHLKQLQDKENSAEEVRAQEEQEKQRQIEEEQQDSLKELSQKASDINDNIIRLSKQQDYEGMKVQFAALEKTVTALTTLKDQMAKQKDLQEREKELARESNQRRMEMFNAQKREDQQIHAYETAQPQKEEHTLSNQPSDLEHYKNREIMQEQNMLFSEGVDLYGNKKYTQAKLLFGELADQHDRRAEPWLKKVDHAITRELLNSEAGEARERTAFIADQVNAQRELIIIQERERQRQKKLTEELEHQKRLYEDDRSLELRKEETMKAQERERQRQEEKRLRLEKENEKQQAMLRFHKIVIPPPEVKPPQPAPVPVAVTPPPVVSAPAAIVVPADVIAAQREQERQAKIKSAEDARQQRIEERQKEKERQKELRAQRESERQARIKAEEEAREKIKEEKQKEKEHEQELKTEQAQAQTEKLAQEEKRREEFLHQQEQQREERMKQDEIIREETQRRQEMERQERERQSQLEAQRETVRKQLEDGVEAMYQEAMRLYQQGEYSAAADRFKDVQDILPDYKRAGQYMDEARVKSLAVKPQAVIASDTSSSASSPSVSHQDNVSKALDLFDPNAK